jgi:hypothetical protein
MATIETYTELTLDLLTEKGVSVLTKTYADINGVKTQIGTNHRKAYGNSPIGRELLVKDIPENYYNAVLAVWGEEPVLQDPENPNAKTEVSEEVVETEEVTEPEEVPDTVE